ncbi:hypothetical protein PIIN_10340 [Serendipita indica DSM 11827]|uniref:Granulins domain-containing protein n=1 Tax=Serendipita indica (strain DSM 11827) TaxID=1109443 RepID=G4TYF2_SERID|nr:hypothetical protein PIIN_10340 [Serendipita indica DSM 11827]
MRVLVVLIVCTLAQASLVRIPSTLLGRKMALASEFHESGVLRERQTTCGGLHSCSSGGCCSGQCCLSGCCPVGYYCDPDGNTPACCPTGRICSGPPIGCANPGTVECANYDFCCPPGQTCSLDAATGAAQCNGVTVGQAPPPPISSSYGGSPSDSPNDSSVISSVVPTSVIVSSSSAVTSSGLNTIAGASTTARTTSNLLGLTLSSSTPQIVAQTSSEITGSLSGTQNLRSPTTSFLGMAGALTMAILLGIEV